MTVSESKECLDLSEEYPDYLKREKIKSQGWKIIGNPNSSLFQKASAYLSLIIWAHYWRAREILESSRYHKTILKQIMGNKYYSGYILDIDHYIRHWLYSHREKVDPEILNTIEKEFHYSPQKNKYLLDGHTMYEGF